ncbi:MAG: hypothetical protein ACI8XV_000219, partial [Arenicella sp.]
ADNWPLFANEAGVSETTIEKIRASFRSVTY